MRVLFITPFFEPARSYGGMVTTSSSWAHAISNFTSVNVVVFTTTANGHVELNVEKGKEIYLNRVKVVYFERYRWTKNRYVSVQMINGFMKYIKSYDVVHLVGLWTFGNMIASRICRMYKIPYVVSLHGLLMPWSLSRHKFRKKIFLSLMELTTLRKAQGIICSTEFEKKHFMKLGITTEDRVKVIPHVTEPPQIDIKESRERFRAKYDLDNSFVLIFAGRIVENKGLHLSISAFAEIIKDFPTARFFIMGPKEDDSLNKIQELSKLLRVSDKINYLGMVSGEGYWDALAGADLFVLNSYSENYANVVIEALSMGTAVLISDQVGVKDIVMKSDAGIVSSLDVKEIAVAMRSLLTQPERLTEMGQNGIKLSQNFNSSIVGEQLVTYFEEIIASARRVV